MKRCVFRKERKTLNLIDSVQLLKAFTVRSSSLSSFFNSSPKRVSLVDSAPLSLSVQITLLLSAPLFALKLTNFHSVIPLCYWVVPDLCHLQYLTTFSSSLHLAFFNPMLS
ncbi:hypothetical protein VNO80_08153 [Phaseolus coccineus]|uniref:Uncharacterized protein n=1 Tax=Phaseolus coccineus TaxID=3886 RepID=A0AAN9NKJ7_PHACN